MLYIVARPKTEEVPPPVNLKVNLKVNLEVNLEEDGLTIL